MAMLTPFNYPDCRVVDWMLNLPGNKITNPPQNRHAAALGWVVSCLSDNGSRLLPGQIDFNPVATAVFGVIQRLVGPSA